MNKYHNHISDVCGLGCPSYPLPPINAEINAEKANLIIAYGAKDISLNKGSNHLVLSREELAFIVQSAINNGEVQIKATPLER